MNQYWVEGLYRKKGVRKNAGQTGKTARADLEPYAKTIWANTPEEAARLATEEIVGSEWVEGPKISRKSEDVRMRDLGAPELPGLRTVSKKQGGKRHE
jgi:hypothetical protein